MFWIICRNHEYPWQQCSRQLVCFNTNEQFRFVHCKGHSVCILIDWFLKNTFNFYRLAWTYGSYLFFLESWFWSDMIDWLKSIVFSIVQYFPNFWVRKVTFCQENYFNYRWIQNSNVKALIQFTNQTWLKYRRYWLNLLVINCVLCWI